ncbi:MAG: DUF1003 domain-containing protein [Weeksellaceae bacterium]
MAKKKIKARKTSTHKLRNVRITPKALLSNRHVKSLKQESDRKRTIMEKFVDIMTNSFGSNLFLSLNIVWFVVWITINVGLVPGVKPFDPYPFGFLTMTVSLEAIVLSIIVLISQNRSARLADLREELNLQVDTITEREITKLINMQILMMKKHGFDIKKDPDLEKMMEPLDTSNLKEKLADQLQAS